MGPWKEGPPAGLWLSTEPWPAPEADAPGSPEARESVCPFRGPATERVMSEEEVTKEMVTQRCVTHLSNHQQVENHLFRTAEEKKALGNELKKPENVKILFRERKEVYSLL